MSGANAYKDPRFVYHELKNTMYYVVTLPLTATVMGNPGVLGQRSSGSPDP